MGKAYWHPTDLSLPLLIWKTNKKMCSNSIIECHGQTDRDTMLGQFIIPSGDHDPYSSVQSQVLQLPKLTFPNLSYRNSRYEINDNQIKDSLVGGFY